MKRFIVSAIVFFGCLASAQEEKGVFLFQSLKNVDQTFIVPTDIKKATVIVSVAPDCSPECLRQALGRVSSLDNYRHKIDFIFAVPGGLWRVARDKTLNLASLETTKSSLYHDPAGRFRNSVSKGAGYTSVTFYGASGKRLWNEELSSPLNPEYILKKIGNN